MRKSVEGEKQRIREAAWSRLEAERVALFPGARGRIPNFKGAGQAAQRLASTREWKDASTIKCNPDAAQRPVRLRALRDGKRVYMAVPRLAELRCFWELDPGRLPEKDLAAAATIKGASRLGLPVDPRRMPAIDLVVAGSVAVDHRGARVGKGGGYSDLEYAVGRQIGILNASTPVATTVHRIQIFDEELPTTAHDFFLYLIVTPEEVFRPGPGERRQPEGVLRSHLTAELEKGIPILRALRF